MMYVFFNMMMEPICDYCFHLEMSTHLFTESTDNNVAVKATSKTSNQAEGGENDKFVQISNFEVLHFITWKFTGIGNKPFRTHRLYERAKEYLDQRLDVISHIKSLAQIKFVSD